MYIFVHIFIHTYDTYSHEYISIYIYTVPKAATYWTCTFAKAKGFSCLDFPNCCNSMMKVQKVHVYTYICKYMHTLTYTCTYRTICIYIVYVYIYTCIYKYIYIYVYICIHIYIYIYIYRLRWRAQRAHRLLASYQDASTKRNRE